MGFALLDEVQVSRREDWLICEVTPLGGWVVSFPVHPDSALLSAGCGDQVPPGY